MQSFSLHERAGISRLEILGLIVLKCVLIKVEVEVESVLPRDGLVGLCQVSAHAKRTDDVVL